MSSNQMAHYPPTTSINFHAKVPATVQRGIGTRGNADASEAKRKLIRLNWSEPEKERE